MRAIVIAPLVIAAMWLSGSALDAAQADLKLGPAVREMETWAASGGQPREDTWNAVRDELLAAEKAEPLNPTTQELIAALDVRRTDRPELLEEALSRLNKALQRRPVSPYTWAAMAETRYRIGDTGPRFENALARAVELGPHEPAVQRTVSLYALATWDELRPETRVAVERIVRAATLRSPEEMMRIGERRGRLDIVCRHLAGTPRQTDPTWLRRCKSAEAT